MKLAASLEPDRAPGHPMPRALEEVAFDPGGADRLPEVQAHLVRCGVCREEVDQLRAERAHFLVRRPPRAFAAEQARRSMPRPSRVARVFAPLGALAAGL